MEMHDLHDITCQLTEAQRLYDICDYDRSRIIADKVAGVLEHAHREESIEYSEAMRIFGMASYRMNDLAMADGALVFAYNARNKAGFGSDDIAKEILMALSEVAILRNDTIRANEMLELLHTVSE